MKWSKERREAYEIAKKIVRVMEGDLLAFGQARVRVEPDGSVKRVPMRTFYVKPSKKFKSPAEHMAELKKFCRKRSR